MPNGGYKIIDLNGANFNFNTQVKINGIYSEIEKTNKSKPILFNNFSVGGLERNSFFSPVTVSGGAYNATVAAATDHVEILRINSNDMVTYSSSAYVAPSVAALSENAPGESM